MGLNDVQEDTHDTESNGYYSLRHDLKHRKNPCPVFCGSQSLDFHQERRVHEGIEKTIDDQDKKEDNE